MKKEFRECPACMRERQMWGFDWKEFVTAIPSPLAVMTSYKANGKTNAAMQSWLTFASADGFYCIFADVSRYGHLYQTLREKKALVINFPSADIYKKCYSTIANNAYEEDEIQRAGLTAEPAEMVDAPRIKECFLNLECEYAWEKELSADSAYLVLCVKVVNVVMDEAYYDERRKGRYGDTGYLYNIHTPINPETGQEETEALGTIRKYAALRDL